MDLLGVHRSHILTVDEQHLVAWLEAGLGCPQSIGYLAHNELTARLLCEHGADGASLGTAGHRAGEQANTEHSSSYDSSR